MSETLSKNENSCPARDNSVRHCGAGVRRKEGAL